MAAFKDKHLWQNFTKFNSTNNMLQKAVINICDISVVLSLWDSTVDCYVGKYERLADPMVLMSA